MPAVLKNRLVFFSKVWPNLRVYFETLHWTQLLESSSQPGRHGTRVFACLMLLSLIIIGSFVLCTVSPSVFRWCVTVYQHPLCAYWIKPGATLLPTGTGLLGQPLFKRPWSIVAEWSSPVQQTLAHTKNKEQRRQNRCLLWNWPAIKEQAWAVGGPALSIVISGLKSGCDNAE